MEQASLWRLSQLSHTHSNTLTPKSPAVLILAYTLHTQSQTRIIRFHEGSVADFDPWIWDLEYAFSGSRIPNPYFPELSDSILGKKYYSA
jgi:hypothetical protein